MFTKGIAETFVQCKFSQLKLDIVFKEDVEIVFFSRKYHEMIKTILHRMVMVN